MSAADSKAVFLARLAELELQDLKSKFEERGWVTFNDFAFSCSDPTGKDAEAFKKEILDVLVPDKEDAAKIPRIRRLYTQSYVIGSAEMERFGNPTAVDEKVTMHPADRTSRTEAVKAKLTGFAVSGPSIPSFALIDRFATILAKGAVRYVPWEKCTSREQELLEQPEVKGLRLSDKGMLVQDIAPDPSAPLSGELLWEFALRRRAIAGEIVGVLAFSTANLWHDTLRSAILAPPPPGYRAITYSQLRAADQKLYSLISEACNDGTKCKPGEEVSEFEKAFKIAMFDINVRLLMQPLPSGPGQGAAASSSGSAAAAADPEQPAAKIRKLENRLRAAEDQLKAARRRLENSAGKKGAGKSRRGGKNPGSNVPDGLRGKFTRLANGDPICFNFHLGGCSAAKVGQRCPRGWHLCPEPVNGAACGGAHTLQQHA